MGAKENKAIVRRFWDEMIIGGNVDVAEELLAPNYVNLIVEGQSADAPTPMPDYPERGDDRSKLKAAVTSYLASIKKLQFEVLDMAAEGDAVFARINQVVTLHDGSTQTARGLAYYQLADGKIVLNDLLSVPT